MDFYIEIRDALQTRSRNERMAMIYLYARATVKKESHRVDLEPLVIPDVAHG